ncbi:MAG: phosphoglycerate kinase [Cryomorphaceae bacterium]|jgi:phosphoglycerate kinase|nr:phosphoglycerate kinase [Cryomorphaceae bacterium]
MKTIEQLDVRGKRILVRVDYNVPLREDGEVANNQRIVATIPTLKSILDRGGRAVLVSHLGRPKAAYEAAYSLRPVAVELARILGREVQFSEYTVGPEAVAATKALQDGEVLLMENVRFFPGEESGDAQFARQLAELGDAYVNDAFGTAHRAHASTAVVAAQFAGRAAFGHVMAREIANVDRVLQSKEKPSVAVVGGSKVSSKIVILERLLDRVDALLIGGGMAFTFLKAQGAHVGNSLVEDEHLGTAKHILEAAKAKGVDIYLPVDVVAADRFAGDAATQIVSSTRIPDGWMGLDVGPETVAAYAKVVGNAKTLLWNGPLGVFELEAFAHGTRALGEAIASATASGSLFSLVGGGDSVAAVEQFGLADRVSYVSTGGGAMLEYLEGRVLPGIQAVYDAE